MNGSAAILLARLRTFRTDGQTAARIGGMANRIALFLLYTFALSVGVSTAGLNISYGLLLLVTIPVLPRLWREASRLPLFWLMAGLTGYVVVQSLVQIHLHPRLAEASNPNWSHVARVTGLASLPLAWWLRRHWHHLPWLLIVAAVGAAIGLGRNIGDWSTILAGNLWIRSAWGGPPGLVSYLAGLPALACVVFAGRLLLHGQLRQSWAPALAALTVAAVFTVVLWGVQTRAAWIAAGIVVVGFVAVSTMALLRARRFRRLAALGAACAIAVAGLIGLSDHRIAEQRLGHGEEMIAAVLAVDHTALNQADRALGLRLNMWTEGLKAFLERPLFGWGIGAKPLISERSDRPIGYSGHFHNLYLEILIGLGLVGFLPFAAVTTWLILAALAWRPGNGQDGHLRAVTLAMTLFTAIVLLAEVRVGHPPGRAAIMLILALLLVPALNRGRRTGSSAEISS